MHLLYILIIQPIYTLTCNQIYHNSQDLEILLILRRFQTFSIEIYCCGESLVEIALPQQDLRQRDHQKYRIRQIPMGFVTLHKAKKQKDDFLRCFFDESVVVNVLKFKSDITEGIFGWWELEKVNMRRIFLKALDVTAHGGL